MLFSKKEFEVLWLLKEKPFLKREAFDSEESFDDACQIAKEMFDNGIIESLQQEPYRRNTSGSGSTYAFMGKFILTTAAREAVSFENYEAYKKAHRASSWNLSNRLAVLAIVVALLGVVITMYLSSANGA